MKCVIKRQKAKNIFLVTVLLIMAGVAGCTPALKKEAQQPEEALRQVRFFSPNSATTWIVTPDPGRQEKH